MKRIFIAALIALACNVAFADCPSKATLNVKSSTYSGAYDIELRNGNRPGSRVVGARALKGNGTTVFSSVCAGKYFFAFGTPDSDQVSVTQYFNVKNDGKSYSSPTITVFYTRSVADGHRVESKKRRDL